MTTFGLSEYDKAERVNEVRDFIREFLQDSKNFALLPDSVDGEDIAMNFQLRGRHSVVFNLLVLSFPHPTIVIYTPSDLSGRVISRRYDVSCQYPQAGIITILYSLHDDAIFVSRGQYWRACKKAIQKYTGTYRFCSDAFFPEGTVVETEFLKDSVSVLYTTGVGCRLETSKGYVFDSSAVIRIVKRSTKDVSVKNQNYTLHFINASTPKYWDTNSEIQTLHYLLAKYGVQSSMIDVYKLAKTCSEQSGASKHISKKKFFHQLKRIHCFKFRKSDIY